MLTDRKYKGYNVVIIGHSLYGLVSTINAADITSKFNNEFLLLLLSMP